MNGSTDYEIRVDVSIQNYQGGGNLRLSEQVVIPDCTFADMAEILAGFHELAKSIKAAKERTAVMPEVAADLSVSTSQRFTAPQWDWLTAQAYARSSAGVRVSVAQVVRELVEAAMATEAVQ